MLNSVSLNFNNFLTSAKNNTTNPVRRTNYGLKTLQADEFQKSPQKNPKKDPNKLSIFYYNDTHGNSDSMAGVANAAQNFSKSADKNAATTFILSAGDNYSGADSKKNSFIVDLMQNIMGVEYSAVGNHELDAASKGFIETNNGKKVEFIATNVEFDDDNPMEKLVKKSEIVEKDGVKYGFIGTMPLDFSTVTKKENTQGLEVMDFDDTIEALQDEIDEFKKRGVDRIILLSHVGYDIDKKIAQNLDGVDIIIGGHSHTLVEGTKERENLVKSKSNEPVIITQAKENGEYFGELNVEFDEKGVIKKVQNNVQKAQTKKSPVIEFIKGKALGESQHVATIKEIDPMPENRRIEPSAWTCLIADSMKEELGADIAIVNSANIRKVPKEGSLTERDISESAPMKNNLVKLKITQKQLVESVKNAAKSSLTSPDGYPGLLQGSGFGYKIDESGNLLEMNIIDKNGSKTPVDIKNPSEKITYDTICDTFVILDDGETPELAPKFGFEEYDFDKDKTMTDFLLKNPDKENLKVRYDNRIEIQKTSQSKPKNNNTRNI